MVFRGKPSKACERCRARRLKCDRQIPSCGCCVRARSQCSGYRDVQQLRIQDETKSVISCYAAHPNIRSAPLSADLQAREAFFAYYVNNKTACWDFLKLYYHQSDSPAHLNLAIEAVSLAYLWQYTYSNASLILAREKYVAALRKIRNFLMSETGVAEYTALLATVLLDLYEKLTAFEPKNTKSTSSHVDGALALARVRGLDKFQDPSQFAVLSRLSEWSLVDCVTRSTSVPEDLAAVLKYVGQRRGAQGPIYQAFNLMVSYANFRHALRQGKMSAEQCIRSITDLHAEFEGLELRVRECWSHLETRILQKSEPAFRVKSYTYPSRVMTQLRNFLSLVRILLVESLLKYYLEVPVSRQDANKIEEVRETLKELTSDICASVAQYLDCNGAARHRLPGFQDQRGSLSDQTRLQAIHSHTPAHRLECYPLIFPLYTAGRSDATPGLRLWVTGQLQHMSCHFQIRNAKLVADILESGKNVDPWEVYAMLGSHAYGA